MPIVNYIRVDGVLEISALPRWEFRLAIRLRKGWSCGPCTEVGRDIRFVLRLLDPARQLSPVAKSATHRRLHSIRIASYHYSNDVGMSARIFTSDSPSGQVKQENALEPPIRFHFPHDLLYTLRAGRTPYFFQRELSLTFQKPSVQVNNVTSRICSLRCVHLVQGRQMRILLLLEP